MALDGAFLHCLRDELRLSLQESRIDKIHQPSKEELVFAMRGRNGTEKLYLSARVNSPRVQLTAVSLENPATPPPFCMLLRKRLTGARLVDVRQPGLERVLYFDFDALNELGDTVRLTVAAELMGRHSNLILIGEGDRIVDAIKRVDLSMSPIRPILPGAPYLPPPSDASRYDALLCEPSELADVVLQSGLPTDKALQSAVQGFSPLICREIAHRVGEEVSRERLAEAIGRVREALQPNGRRVPYLLYRPDGSPLEFSFLPITQYGLDATGREAPTFSALLDDFYAEKDAAERMRRCAHDITRTLTTVTERLIRKLDNQRRELAASGEREQKRLYADLINANLHAIPKGASSVDLMNYYDENCAMLTVPLDPSLPAARNAQKYYKEYRKAKTAEEILQQQIALGENELLYLESVSDALSRAKDSRELEELRRELEQSGYLHAKKDKRRAAPPTKPLSFRSDDGFTILVGRNNVQNDQLTTRTAKGSDWWFHTKNIPGSHTVILTDGVEPPETTLRQAAILAATHSKAAASAQVPVDYTQIRHVKKPSGAKPGMVIYENNRTVYVTPDTALCERLRAEP
ncbi:MAG: NFACT family protein [Clostridia bacterium]|nr:NFACT family protein [Clostridia bacterium]